MDMKKDLDKTPLLKSETSNEKYLETDKIKTTNINILLNRVKLDKKKTFKKKVIFSILLISIVSLIASYFII